MRAVPREIAAGWRAAWRAFRGDPNPTATPADVIARFPGLASGSKRLTKS